MDLEDVKTLIIDDNAANRLILSEMLSRWGAVVTEAEGGEQGIAELIRAKQAGSAVFARVAGSTHAGRRWVPGGRTNPSATQPWPRTTILMLTSENRAGRHRARSCARGRGIPRETGEAGRVARGDPGWRAAGAVPAAERPAAQLGGMLEGAQGLRILLAEDSQDNVLLIQSYLKASGYSADVACNGEVALEKFISGSVRRRAHGRPDADHGRLLRDAQDPAVGSREPRHAGSDPGADRARSAGRSPQEPRRRLHRPPYQAHTEGDAARVPSKSTPWDLSEWSRASPSWSPAFSTSRRRDVDTIAAALERSDYDNVRIWATT